MARRKNRRRIKKIRNNRANLSSQAIVSSERKTSMKYCIIVVFSFQVKILLEENKMQNLKVIENELVPVYQTSTGEKVVYGSELHVVLEVKSRYNDWIKNRLEDCEAIENEDFDTFTKNLVNGGRIKEYIIKLDTAKEMAMLERNEKGKQVRRYFIQIEKKYKEKIILDNPLEGISPELQAVIVVDKRVTKVEQSLDNVKKEFENFKEELPIFGVDEDKIQTAVRRKGVEVLGGKNSNSYKDKSIHGKVFSDIYRELKRQFGITGTYKQLRRNQCDTAVKIIEAYRPPMFLAEQVKNCNAQINMEVA